MLYSRSLSIFLINLFFAVIILCAGCSAPPEETGDHADTNATPIAGGTYTAPLPQDQATLDPARVTEHHGVGVVNQLFDGLVLLNANMLVHPALATSWTVSEEGTVYTFQLSPHAIFHDGAPVRASDVVFTLERLLRLDPPTIIQPLLLLLQGAEAYRDGETEHVAGLIAKDDTTVLMKLTRPDARFLVALSMYQAKIVPEHVVRGNEAAFGKAPIGTGPFYLDSWLPDKSITLKRFDGYYSRPAWLDEVVYRIYPGGNNAQMLADFTAGLLDEMPVYGDAKTTLAEIPNLNWVRRTSLSVLFYGIRTDHPGLRDVRVRHALSLAINREKLIQDIYGGKFQPAFSIIPPGMPGHLPVKRDFAQDMQTAKALINQATHGNPTSIGPIELVSSVQSQFSTKELAFIQSSWEALGVKVRIKYITSGWNDFKAYLKTDQTAVHRRVLFADLPDPDSFLTPLIASDGLFNEFHYVNPQVDRLLAEAGQTQDPRERASRYQDIEKLLAQDIPLIPLFYLSVERVYKPRVRGINVNALDQAYVLLADFWLSSPTAN